jgi:hypothetical protein
MAAENLREWSTSKFGSCAILLIALGFVIEFLQMVRPGQGCHPPTFDWFWHVGRLAFFGMLVGFILSIIGILADARRGRAVGAFVLFIPLFLLILAASDCG